MVAAELPLEADGKVSSDAAGLTEMIRPRLALDGEALIAEPSPLPQPTMSAANASRMRTPASSVGINAPVATELLSGQAPNAHRRAAVDAMRRRPARASG